MGQIANDILDGTCCDICGAFFQNPVEKEFLYTHDYPVTCWDCWQDLNEDERKQHQRALVDTVGE